jgi:hypothetical protein
MPLVALVTAYVYLDARTRGELETESDPTGTACRDPALDLGPSRFEDG